MARGLKRILVTGGLRSKTFRKVGKLAAVAAATYFTGGAALPMILKMRGMLAAGAGPSDLLNEAWDGANVSNNLGLGGLLDQVGENPLTTSLLQSGRALLAGRHRPQRAAPPDEDEEELEPEDVDEEDEDYEE